MSEQQHVGLLDRVFSLLIAFILPGVAALAGIATVNETVKGWFAGAQANPSFVGYLFVLLAALGLGMIISGVRWFVFERIDWFPTCPIVPAAPAFDLSKRKEFEEQFRDISHQHYYYYLHHANSSVAVVVAAAAWLYGHVLSSPAWMSIAISAGAIALAVMLGSAGCNAITRHDQHMRDLLGEKNS